MKTPIEYLHEGYERNLIVYNHHENFPDVDYRLVLLVRNVLLAEKLNTEIEKIISPRIISYDKVPVHLEVGLTNYYKELGGFLMTNKQDIVIFVNKSDDAILASI